MISSDDQEQTVTDGSTAIQAGGNVTITSGFSYAEVRDIALDVYRANFYTLVGAAKETAEVRAQQITDEFLTKLQVEHPAGFAKGDDPDFQYALFTVQREYARHGDREIGDLLVDLLVDRSKQEQRDILQLVLTESLGIAPKLTSNQLSALSVIFLFKYTQNTSIGNHELLGVYLDKFVERFSSSLVKNRACYQHLEFTGCGAIGLGSRSLESILGTTYQGQFMWGFDSSELAAKGVSCGADANLFMTSLNDPTKLQVRANSKEVLTQLLERHGVSVEDRTKITELFDVGKMSDVEIREKCIAIRPYMATVFDTWSDSPMEHFTLTSVGIAIGHANIKRVVGDFSNLSIWIN
jgi:hypothetical protein